MNILHIIPSYYPAIKHGGPISSVHLLNKALVKKGIVVHVLTTTSGIENNNIVINEWQNIDGVKVKYFPYYFYEHYTFSPHLFCSALNEIKKYDLVHITAFWNFPTLVGCIGSLLNKKPYIISPRGVLYKDAINIKSKYIKKLYFNLIANHYLRRASAVHFTTQDEKDNVANFVKVKCPSFVVPNGLDIAEYNSLPKRGDFKEKYLLLREKKYILFLGRIHKQKGLDILINAFKELCKFDNDLFLVIAGPDFGYKNEVEKQLNQYGLLNKTLFAGMLTGRSKLAAYVDAEVFVLPSYFENFGMVAIEAMACGTPIVITNKVGIYKDVENEKYKSGLVVDPKAESIYQGIKSLLNNTALRDEIVINGRNLVRENYNIDKVADMMIDVYKNIL